MGKVLREVSRTNHPDKLQHKTEEEKEKANSIQQNMNNEKAYIDAYIDKKNQ